MKFESLFGYDIAIACYGILQYRYVPVLVHVYTRVLQIPNRVHVYRYRYVHVDTCTGTFYGHMDHSMLLQVYSSTGTYRYCNTRVRTRVHSVLDYYMQVQYCNSMLHCALCSNVCATMPRAAAICTMLALHYQYFNAHMLIHVCIHVYVHEYFEYVHVYSYIAIATE